jgi:acetyl esterase/lipase
VEHTRQRRTVPYGAREAQVADLLLPAEQPPPAGWPVVVLIHGGFWRDRYRRDLMVPLADDLAGHGYASWNVEYRRVGPTGGGVPATLEDVAAAVDHLAALAEDEPLDVARVCVVGHSAGGHLALWTVGRPMLPPGVPGASPAVVPCAGVGQAPVASLRAGWQLGDRAPVDFVGGTPDESPEGYRLADPIGLVGHGVPILLAHGAADDTVPVDQSERYEAAASAAGDPVRLACLPGDHDAVIDPDSELWAVARAFLDEHC